MLKSVAGERQASGKLSWGGAGQAVNDFDCEAFASLRSLLLRLALLGLQACGGGLRVRVRGIP